MNSTSTTRVSGGNHIVNIGSWVNPETNHLKNRFRPAGDYHDLFSFFRGNLGSRSYARSYARRSLSGAGVVWFVRDICGIICIFATWALIMYAEFVILFIILMRKPSVTLGLVNGIVYHAFAGLALFSHWKAVTTDPGTVPLGNAPGASTTYSGHSSDVPANIVRCPKCLCIKPPRAHHCRICQRCVRMMDHHCPWINNCVGEGNQKYFVLFTFYICLMSFFAIYLCAYYLIQCMSSDWETCQTQPGVLALDFSPMASSAFTLGLIFEAFVFGLFTLIMCITQLCAISNNETGIENLKKEQNWSNDSKIKNLVRTFGYPISWRWLSPFSKAPTEHIISEPYDYFKAENGCNITSSDIAIHLNRPHEEERHGSGAYASTMYIV